MRTGIALSATAHLILVTLAVVLAGPAPFEVEPAEGILVDLVTPAETQGQAPEETAKVDEPEKAQEPEIEKTQTEFAKAELAKDEKKKEEKAKEEKNLPAAQDLLQDLRKEFQAEAPKEAAKEPEKEPAKDAPKETSKEAAKGPPPAGPSMPPPPMPPVRPPELARPDSAPPSSPPEAPPQDAQPAEAPPAGPALADIPLPAMAEAPADEVPPPLAPDLLMDMARLGKANGFDDVAEERAKLTPNEIAAFRASVQKCWKRPDNVPANAKLTIVLQVSLKPNGSLAGVPDPIAIEGAAAKFGPAFMRAAQTALRTCAPYASLPPGKYSQWRVLDLRFTPAGIVGG